MPDWVVIPGGNLGNVSALGAGFLMMQELGLIQKLPRICVAQAAAANPLYLAYKNGWDNFEPLTAKPTLASAIQIGNPVSVKKAIRTLQRFDGVVEQASEAELADAAAAADRTGLFNCPHTGVALAALEKLVARGEISERRPGRRRQHGERPEVHRLQGPLPRRQAARACRTRSTPTTRCCCPTTTRSSATPSAARSTRDGGRVRVKGGVRPAAPFVLLGLAFVLTLVLQKSFLVQSDEGYTLNAAWQMWNGMKMYDDFRLFVAPGAGCAVYAVWAMFGGPSFLSARVLSLLLSFSSIVAVVSDRWRGAAIRGATLAVAVAAWTIASAQYVLLNHNTFSSYAARWMLLALLRAQERDRAGAARLRDHALVGVAAGIVTLFLQTKGLALLAAASAVTLFAGVARRGIQAAAVLVGAATAVVAPLFSSGGRRCCCASGSSCRSGATTSVRPARRARSPSAPSWSPPRWRRSRSACAIGC